MAFRARGLLLSLVTLAGVSAPAFADDVMLPHKHKARAAHAMAPRAVKGPIYGDVVLPVGSVKDPGSDNRYFSDTITPGYSLGPTIFGRWQ